MRSGVEIGGIEDGGVEMRTDDAKTHCYKLADHLRDLDSDSRDAVAIETLLGALMPQKTLRDRLIDTFHNAMTHSLKGIEGTTAFYTAGKFREGIAAGIDALILDGFLTLNGAAQWKPISEYTVDKIVLFTNDCSFIEARSFSQYGMDNGYCQYTHWMNFPPPPPQEL